MTAPTTTDLSVSLQETLVELIDLSLQAKHYHWNVTGQEFRGIHLFLDEITDQVRLWYDDVAERLATRAGDLLLDVRAEYATADAAERKAAGDKRSHDFLMKSLAAERPDDVVLSEEGADDPVRLTAGRVWIVDPLDGTRESREADQATADAETAADAGTV